MIIVLKIRTSVIVRDPAIVVARSVGLYSLQYTLRRDLSYRSYRSYSGHTDLSLAVAKFRGAQITVDSVCSLTVTVAVTVTV